MASSGEEKGDLAPSAQESANLEDKGLWKGLLLSMSRASMFSHLFPTPLIPTLVAFVQAGC